MSVIVKGKHKGFVWAWAERVHPKKARVINNDVMAVVVPSLSAKEVLISALDPSIVVIDPHYDGYPVILVRLEVVSFEELSDLVIEAWRCKAPKEVVAGFDSSAHN